METLFTEQLLTWYQKEGRSLPWRETTDPYHIVVSEIMLQQTQVDRVIPKYILWIKQFPTWRALAAADRAAVLTAWSGLGYNSRALRLQLLARIVCEQGFPESEENLRAMPGIGPYTAGAVVAFAFDRPGLFIDVNVSRVLKRYFFTPRQRPGADQVAKKLLALQTHESPRILGNALMDLGSLFCTATQPTCITCPVVAHCRTRGERPDEQRARAKKRQAPFLHSNRWWRGQILKELTKGSSSREELRLKIPFEGDEKLFFQALAQLEKEGFIERAEKTEHIRISDAQP